MHALATSATKPPVIFSGMLRLSLATALAFTSALALIPQSEAYANAWQKNRQLSKEYADKGEWRKACRRGILAGAAMIDGDALTVEYMARIGKRCTEAAR